MNAHTTLLALILMWMALTGCEPVVLQKAGVQPEVAATIYLNSVPTLPLVRVLG